MGRARGRRARARSSCRRTRRWRRSRRRATTAPRSSSSATALEDALAAARRVRRASTARRSSIRSRTRWSIAGQGTIGLELVEQVPELATVRASRSAAAGSPRASRSRCARGGRACGIVGVQAAGTMPGGSGFTIADGIAVKQPGELTMTHPRRGARRHRDGDRRGDQRGDRAAARTHEARRRGRGRGRRRGAPARARSAARAGRDACSPAGTSTRRCSSR